MKSILVQWKKQLTKVLCKSANSDATLHEILSAHADCYGFLYWGDKTLHQTRHIIGIAYIETKKRLHSRRSRDMRKGFSSKIKQMEENCSIGKLKETISYVMGPKRKYYNFKELLVLGEPINDQKEIHESITAHFEDWFSANPDTGQISNDINAYTDLMLPWPNFQQRFSKSKISDPLLLTLHRALNSGPSPEKLNIMNETLRKIPSIIEFRAVIEHAKNGTAPGLSGLTYTVIKLWPGVLVDFVFEQLSILWSTNSYPNHWSDKWIAPIPKTTDPTLESLRPIALLEVLRKLWVAIIIHRIQSLFQTGGYLHPAQHGCLRGVGTDEAIMEITNILEATKEKQGEVYIASWDMRRAFDRVPKSFLIFSWIRMGVPLDIARYLVELDIDGTTIVKTPFAQSQIYRHGSTIKEDIGFTAETGCAQGDPQSAISWNCFIDILLVALHDKENNNNFFLNHNGLQITQQQSAYVDDILSILFSSQDLQREADIVSAFTIISSMEISIPKLKAYRFNWGNPNIPGVQNFTVHTAGWIPNIVQLASSGAFKYLGLWIDNDLQHQNQFEITKQQLLLLCDQIICAKIKPEAKLRVISASLFPKIIYSTKFASWFLSQYQELDRIMDRTFRVITKCLPTTSKHLLHMKAEHGGLELPKLSTTINERKLKLLQRLDQQSYYRKATVQSLIGRGARSQGHILPVGYGTSLTAPLYSWWITSLTQELSLNGMSLTIHGIGSNNIVNHSVYQWKTLLTPGLKAASVSQGEPGVSLLTEMSNSIENIPLRVGQVWAAYHESFQSLTEIIGFEDEFNSIICQSWEFSNNLLTPGSVVFCKSNSQDTSNIIKHTYDSLFPIGQVSYLVVLYNALYTDIYSRKIVISKHQHRPMKIQRFIPPCNLIDILEDLGQHVTKIYTDGGWKKVQSRVDPLHQVTLAGGAIVLQYENGTYGCIQLAMDLPVNSVYPVELLALTVARIIAKGSLLHPEIHTDSQAALNTMVSISKGKIQNQYLQFITAHENLYAPFNVFHVKSHIEKREKNARLWSIHERGNFIADSLTLHDWSLQQEARIRVGPSLISIARVAGVKFSNLLAVLSQRNSFAITSIGLPFIYSLKTQSQDKLKDTYIYLRDDYRVKRGDRVKWAKRDLRSLKYTHPPLKTLNDKVLRMKIIFNKHWNGANQAKYASPTAREDSTLGICQLCGTGEETQQHIMHLCLHKDMVACRSDILCNINTQITQLKKQHPDYGIPLDALRDIAYTTNNTFLWTGLWPKDIIRRTAVSLYRIDPKIQLIKLLKLARVFTQETKRLYQTRADILNIINRQNIIITPAKKSPSILNCFPRKSKTKVSLITVNKLVTTTPKKTPLKPQVVMKKITQYFVKRQKIQVAIPTTNPNHPDSLPSLTLDKIITEFRNKDVPFSFRSQERNPPSAILTRSRCKPPYLMSTPVTETLKRKRRNQEPGITPVLEPRMKTQRPRNSPSPPSEDETLFSSTRDGIG